MRKLYFVPFLLFAFLAFLPKLSTIYAEPATGLNSNPYCSFGANESRVVFGWQTTSNPDAVWLDYGRAGFGTTGIDVTGRSTLDVDTAPGTQYQWRINQYWANDGSGQYWYPTGWQYFNSATCGNSAELFARFTNQGNSATANVDYYITNRDGNTIGAGTAGSQLNIFVGDNRSATTQTFNDAVSWGPYTLHYTPKKAEGVATGDVNCVDPHVASTSGGTSGGVDIYNWDIYFTCNKTSGGGPTPNPGSPTAASGLSAGASCDSATTASVNFSWIPASGGSFDMQYHDYTVAPNTAGDQNGLSVGVGTSLVTRNSLPHNTTIYWRINTHSTDGNWYPSIVAAVNTPNCTSSQKPLGPNGLSAIQSCVGGLPSVTFSWNPSAGAEGYWVDITNDGFGNWSNKNTTSTNTIWSQASPFGGGVPATQTPQNNTSYQWRVYAYNTAGGNHSSTAGLLTLNCSSPNPTPAPTPTSGPNTITIQGRHKNISGADFTLTGQRVTVSGPSGTFSTASTPSWFFNTLAPGTYSVTADSIAGYSIAYSVCTNCSPPGGAYTPGNSLSVNLPFNGNYADIYFRYTSTGGTPTSTPTSSPIPTSTPTPPPCLALGSIVANSPRNNITTSTPSFSWTVPTGSAPITYRVEMTTNDSRPWTWYWYAPTPQTSSNSISYPTNNWTATAGAPAAPQTGLTSGTTYYWRVRATNSCGSVTSMDNPAASGNAGGGSGVPGNGDPLIFSYITSPAWLDTTIGNIGSQGPISELLPAPVGYNSRYLAIARNNISNFTSEANMLIPNYNLTIPGPKTYEDFCKLLSCTGKTAVNNNAIPNGGIYYKNSDYIWDVGTPVTLASPTIIFVEGKVRIQQNLTVSGGGEVMFISKDNVEVHRQVSRINALFLTNGIFDSCTIVACGSLDPALTVNGAVIAHAGVSLERDLGSAINATTPAELFNFNPYFLTAFASMIGNPTYTWQEVRP